MSKWIPIIELTNIELPTAEQLPACHKTIEKILGDVLIRDQYVLRQRLQKIMVRAELDGEHLIVEVSDTGPGIQGSKQTIASGAGIGLKNTVDRLTAFYGENYEFELRRPDVGGLKIYIRLPLKKQMAENSGEFKYSS